MKRPYVLCSIHAFELACFVLFAYDWNFIWISRPPIFWSISKSWSTDCYLSSWVVTTVVWWSYNICLISFNLIIWFNHHVQYSILQTFPIQPVHLPNSTSYQPQVKLQSSQLGSMLWMEKNLERTSQSLHITGNVPCMRLLNMGQSISVLFSTFMIAQWLLYPRLTFFVSPLQISL